MAQKSSSSNYIQDHAEQTIATHLRRSAETEAAFLVPHIKKTDHILDAGCGPGSITIGLAKYVSEGSVIGIDISTDVLHKAKTLAANASLPASGPGSVDFEEGDVLEKLPYADDTFDIVFAAHLFGHLPLPDLPVRALTEMRRVLKPDGILATRDAVAQHFYPQGLDLDRLWVGNFNRAVRKGAPERESTASSMLNVMRHAGFDASVGKVKIGAGSMVYSGPEARKWLAERLVWQLEEGNKFHRSWIDAGISEDEIQETIVAARLWAETEDAWYGSMQVELLAWK